MYTLGIDVGSSSVKVSLLKLSDGSCPASAFYPKEELPMIAVKNGWAEQEPVQWWENMKSALKDVLANAKIDKKAIKAIGISYQMHGLVALDKDGEVIRPSIIWSDSRAVEIGDRAFADLGADYCLSNLLNSPGNFTLSKLKWVKDNEPDKYARIYKLCCRAIILPIALQGKCRLLFQV